MSSVVRIVKRGERAGENISRPAVDSTPAQPGASTIVRTVKGWIEESRDRRRAEADYALGFLRQARESRSCLTLLLAIAFIFLIAQGTARAQESAPASVESLTLEEAIDLALSNNHSVKIARLAVERADEDISVAKTSRLPSLHAYTLVSGNLARNERRIVNPAPDIFPGIGPFISLNDARKPTAVFAASAIEPLSQQYRIGLHIKLERLSRDVAEAKLRQQQNETVDEVKKAYYAILQTRSALGSVQEAVKSYKELDKVTGDYVVQQVALKADHLVVQTRLARVQYEELELSSRLATQKEQLNSLLGRDIGAVFEVADVPAFASFDTDLATARQTAVEHRPELQQARLAVEQSKLARRIKKSEYIPEVSAGFTYLTPRNFDAVVPKNFANVGVVVSWEFFDWGRKKHQLAGGDRTIEQAKTGLKETEDKVLIDVGDKLRRLQLSGQALRVAKLAAESAKENLRVSTGKYKFQAVLLSDVLQSQASLAEAENEYQRALLTFWTARVEFEKALGEEK